MGSSSSEDHSLDSLEGCPPWGLVATAPTGWTGSSPKGETLGRCPRVYRRLGLCQ